MTADSQDVVSISPSSRPAVHAQILVRQICIVGQMTNRIKCNITSLWAVLSTCVWGKVKGEASLLELGERFQVEGKQKKKAR